MSPTITSGEAVQVDLGAFRRTKPQRWDIVLFHPPKYAVAAAQVDLGVWAFRVIGIPGDKITLENDVFFVNGEQGSPPATENKILYMRRDAKSRPEPPGEPIYPLLLPEGKYFVCGDNSASSNDSRYWGPIPTAAIIGKVTNKK